MIVHELKCWPEPFLEIALGRKTCELRYDDRQYKPGDVLILRHWTPAHSDINCEDGVYGDEAIVALVKGIQNCSAPPLSALVAEPLTVLMSIQVLHMTPRAVIARPPA